MVLPCKHCECDSANRQKNCVSTKPKPVPRQSAKANRGNNQKNDTCHQDPANNMERLQPGIDCVPEDHDVLQSLAKRNDWRENENHFGEANNSREKIWNAITFRTEERALISFADHDRDGPQQHGEEREKQISTNQQTDKNFARVPRKTLSFVDCREGEHFGDSPGRVAAKAKSFQAVYLSINEGSDLAPSLQFSALVLHSFNLEDTFLVAADLKLTDQSETFHQRSLFTAR